jgi:hypothetical protein
MYLQPAVILLHARQADLQNTRNRRLYEADLYYSAGEFQSFQKSSSSFFFFFSFACIHVLPVVRLCCRLGDYMHIMTADQMKKNKKKTVIAGFYAFLVIK